MVRVFHVMFAIQLLLGAVWTIPLVSRATVGWEGFYLLVYTFPIHILFMMTAIVFFIARRETRRWAVVVFVTPIVLFFLPSILRGAFGGRPAISGESARFLWIVVFTAPLGLCLFLPKKVVRYIPRAVLASRALNVGIIVGLALMLGAGALLVAALAAQLKLDTSGIGFGAIAAYLMIAAGASCFTFLYGFMGLFKTDDAGHRKFHIAQVALSIPAPFLLVVAMLLLYPFRNLTI